MRCTSLRAGGREVPPGPHRPPPHLCAYSVRLCARLRRKALLSSVTSKLGLPLFSFGFTAEFFIYCKVIVHFPLAQHVLQVSKGKVEINYSSSEAIAKRFLFPS